MRKPAMKFLILFAFCMALASCQKQEAGRPADLHKITITFTDQPQSTLVHIAFAKGYFAEEGLDAIPVKRTFGKAALQTVLDHQSDFATVAETPVMFSILKGENIFVIANIEASTVNNAIVARQDAGITKPGDLKGKRIGYTQGTTSEFFLDSLLTANGLTRRDILPVPLLPENMQDAILKKSVDAVSTWNYPLTLIKHQLGNNATLFYDREIYTETFNIAAQQDFVRKNPEAVKSFLRALIKAENFVEQHPDEAQSIMSADTKIDKGLIREVWNAFNYHVVLDQTLLLTLEDETRWAMNNGLAARAGMPDYRSHIHMDSLRAVNPGAIRMPQ